MSTVRLARHGAVAVIEIANPPVNALSHAVRQALVDCADAADADPECRAVVLICRGRTFIAGADIREFDQPPREPHLPDVVAREFRGEGALVRLPVDVVPARPLYAVSRKAAAEPKRIDLVIRAVTQTVEDVRRGTCRSTMPPPRSTIRPPAYLEGSLLPPRPPAMPKDLAEEATK